MRLLPLLVLGLTLSACLVRDDAPEAPAPEAAGAETVRASFYGDDALPDSAAVEAGRYTRRTARVDTAAQAEAARSNRERLGDVDRTARAPLAWRDSLHLPLGGDVEGPSVLKLQVLLDRAHFSPGEIDGRWGDNTESALVAFQDAAGVGATPGVADSATVRALSERAGRPQALVADHVLTEDDVAGPFAALPEGIYEKAELDALGYESLGEKLGEAFHAAPGLLRRLNGGAALDSIAAGDTLRVPAVEDAPALRGEIARVEVSGEGRYLRGLTASGEVVFHAPATLGAEYDPSPSGDFQITGIARNPEWHYQPKILESVPDDEEDAILPGGPNNAVGTVWMSLSEPHYGIHGTRAPGTIGYASSSGCVRLTNWDVERLAEAVGAGTPVAFASINGREASGGSGGGASGGGDSDSTASRRARTGRTGA